jgi:hypothetical protein
MKQQKILYPKISFCATTIGWSYGGMLHISVGAVAGCSFHISWGDGKQSMIIGEGRLVNFSHDYFPKVMIPEAGISFYVEIVGYEENCRITELSFASIEMVVTQLNLKHCIELEVLISPMMYEPITLDLSKNTALRYLDCSSAKLSELDVSHNTKLVELYCQNNKIKMLNLSNNTALRVLNCEYNKMTVLLIYYGSQLKDATFTEGNNIDVYVEEEIMEITESNPPIEAAEMYEIFLHNISIPLDKK